MELKQTSYSHSNHDSLSNVLPYDHTPPPPMAGAVGHDTAYGGTMEHERAGEALDYYDNVPMPNQRGRAQEFDHYGDTNSHPQHTAYEPLMYR